MKPYKKMIREKKDLERLTYKVYYMDNDRQKKYVKKGLSYEQAISFCQKNYKNYGTDLIYEPDFGR